MNPGILNMVLASTTDVAEHGGYFGTLTSWLLWLLIAAIGVIALYVAGRWLAGEKSMLPAIVVAVIVYLFMYLGTYLGYSGWIFTLAAVNIFYIVMVYVFYCHKTKNLGWITAIGIWLIAFIVSFVLGIIAYYALIATATSLSTAMGYNLYAGWLVLIVIFVIVVYILYKVVQTVFIKPKSKVMD